MIGTTITSGYLVAVLRLRHRRKVSQQIQNQVTGRLFVSHDGRGRLTLNLSDPARVSDDLDSTSSLQSCLLPPGGKYGTAGL